MARSDEVLKVLNMIQEGKLSAEEGAKLLEALEIATSGGPEMAGETQTAESKAAGSGKKAKMMRVRVTDLSTGKTRVNVRLPLSMIGPGIRLGRKFSPELQGIEQDGLMELIQAGEIGQIVDVEDDQDGERVEVFLE